MSKLTDTKAKNIKPGSKPLADGTVDGLRLMPGKEKGRGKWEMRFTSPVTGKRRDMGFGVYPDVSVAEARGRAADARRLLRDGRDPVSERAARAAAMQREAEAMTFQAAAEKAYASRKDGFRNDKHSDQWIQTLRTYAFPKLGNKKVEALKARDFADMLRPIWLTKAETASRVRQRCDAVMEWCIAQELVGANPVKSVSSLLPKQPGKRERATRYPAMAWQDVPEFVAGTLQGDNPSISATMLEFLILTAARSGEVRAMEWSEVDFDTATWTVPAVRMKAKVEHRVPLSDRAVEIIREQEAKAASPTLVFPSPTGKVTTDMILTAFLRGKQVPSTVKGRTATAHGFRSSFRDWASENGYPRDAAERALAHTVMNSAEWSYHRTDLLDQRRVMMQAWADFVCGTGVAGAKVTPIRRAGRKKQ